MFLTQENRSTSCLFLKHTPTVSSNNLVCIQLHTLKEFSKGSSLNDLKICFSCGLKAKLHRKSYVCKNTHACADRAYITTYIP